LPSSIQGGKKRMAILNKIQDFLDNGDQQLMDEIGHYAVTKLLLRTSQGKDKKGNTFKPYSKAYKKIRDKKGLPTAKVDLFFSGKMLGSLTYKTEEKETKLYFTDREQSLKALFNNRKREFFGISDIEQAEIQKMVALHLKKLIES